MDKIKHGPVPQFPFYCSLDVQLRFSDIDMLGHLNNNSYFQILDLGKNNYFSRVKEGYVQWSRPPLMIVNLNCNFLAQTRITEPVVVQTQTMALGDKSVTMMQQIINKDTHEVKCVCQSVLVYYDHETETPASIPQEWREALSVYEHRDL
jgi:acyl-CoA thioester hydrolase